MTRNKIKRHDTTHKIQTGLQTKGGPSNEGPSSKIKMEPQQALAGGGTSKSSSSTDKAIHAIILQSRTSSPTFGNIMMPSAPTPPTFTLQLFLDFPFFD